MYYKLGELHIITITENCQSNVDFHMYYLKSKGMKGHAEFL